jgi:hypothetical protein
MMQMTIPGHRPAALPKPIVVALVVIALLAGSYIYVYQAAPLPEPWSDIYLNLLIIVPALLAAYLSFRTWSTFSSQDRPRWVWFFFMLALTGWAIGEVLWFTTWYITGDVAIPSWSDIFWAAALAPFALAFVMQYRLIYSPDRRQEAGWLLAAAATTLLLSVVGTWLLLQTSTDSELTLPAAFLQVFYAASDFVMMLAGLRLAQVFGRGLWGRAWWGLLAFVISDGLYSYVEFSGLYALSVENGNLLTLVVDLSYALAYMLMALACWSQLLLMRYGPTLAPAESNEFDNN